MNFTFSAGHTSGIAAPCCVGGVGGAERRGGPGPRSTRGLLRAQRGVEAAADVLEIGRALLVRRRAEGLERARLPPAERPQLNHSGEVGRFLC